MITLKKLTVAGVVASVVGLSGCSLISPYPDNKVTKNFAYLQGMPLSETHTPYSASLHCLSEESATNTQYLNQYRHTITVSEIKDLTGKYDFDTGGYKVTQGATNMMMSAIFKTGAYRLVDRSSMEISDMERQLSSSKLVREFDIHDKQRVRDVTAGEIIGSDYKVVGSITEINYNIATGGHQAQIMGLGNNVRTYAMDVGVDLFLVDTLSTQVIDYVSVRKQLVGYETRSGIYRFFDNELFDISLGEKKQEPIQLAVRSAIESATWDFTTKLYGTPSQECLDLKAKADGL